MTCKAMTILDKALSHYETGRLTATGLMLQSLQLIDAENVEAIVESLPPEVAETLKRFVDNYHTGIRVFNGPQPSEESVQIVKAWIADHALLKGGA